jgi:hypothetical protein
MLPTVTVDEARPGRGCNTLRGSKIVGAAGTALLAEGDDLSIA